MSAYSPHDWSIIAAVAGLLALEVAVGYVLNSAGAARGAWRFIAWLMTITATIVAERLTQYEPPGVRMIAVILALLYGMKAVVGVEAGARLSPLRWLGFACLWFGMRPAIFIRAGGASLPSARELILKGLARAILGLLLVVLARLIWLNGESLGTERARWLATPPLLAGLSLVLHFGLFNMLAGGWRHLGVDTRPLFRAPALASSLNEFWSRRWNLAFSEMTALAIYRPASGALGRKAALVLAFIISGALHEVAISVPVLAGVGGPSLYFLLHGLLVVIESRLERRGTPINSRPWLGRCWTLAWLLLPLPILFHRPFLAGIVWPVVGMGG